MSSRDEIRIDMQTRLKWVVVGSGPAPRSEAEMRAIIAWIDRAVDAMLLDPDGFEGSMLRGLEDDLFTIPSVEDGEPTFSLTEKGRVQVDTMPHDPSRLTSAGIKS